MKKLKLNYLGIHELELSKSIVFLSMLWLFLLTGTLSLSAQSSSQKKNIKLEGQVVDSGKNPVIGASIRVKDTPIGTITDVDGKFTLTVPNEKSVVVFSFLGLVTQELKLGNKTTLYIELAEDENLLADVVVIGYGKQTKTSIVSSTSTIRKGDLKTSSRSLTNNIAGQVAGLYAVQRSGEPGRDDAEFWIRGVSTFAGGTKPLVLVDGVPRSFSDVEPDEIESFSVLKDASATAVYGAEGANGVVLITTKRGVVQKASITFKTEHNLITPTRVPEYVNSWEYMELANEALQNDGLDKVFSDELIQKYRDGIDSDLYPNTQWMDELLKKHSDSHRYTLNFRGGTEKTRYFVSGAYYNENGIFKQDSKNTYDSNIKLSRYNLRSNIDIDVTSSTSLNVDLSGQYVLRNQPFVDPDRIFNIILNTPSYMFPAVYSDGTLSTYQKEEDQNNRNPYNLLNHSGYKKEWKTSFQSNVGINQKMDFITKGLSANAKVSFDYDGTFSMSRELKPKRYFATERGEDGRLMFSRSDSDGNDVLGNAVQTGNSWKKIYVEASLNYKRTFANHTVGAMLLYNQKETQYQSEALAYRKQGMVGRVSYAYADRYFLEANFGYTGSEAFAEGNRFGFFPSIGLGYFLSNEPFYPEVLKSTMNKVKFRASFGRTGNDDTGQNRFLYMPVFGGSNGFDQGIGSSGGTNGLGSGLVDTRMENLSIHWEVEDKRNFGIDLGFFDNKVELTVDYFNSTRSDILLRRKTIPGIGGFVESPWSNFGSVNNWGFDGGADVRHKFGALNVILRGTFTFSRNKIVEYDELPQPYPWMSVTGSRVNENYLYIAERLYTNDDFIITEGAKGPSYKLKPELPQSTLTGLIGPGDIKYKDLNEDGVINTFDKKVGVGNPNKPEISYGFGVNLDYKNFYVSAFFQGTGNCDVLLGQGNQTFWPFNWKYTKSNVRTMFLDRWRADDPNNQNVFQPRLHSYYGNNVSKEPSTWWLVNGAFLRFKNLEIGYNIPKSFLEKFKMGAARIYLMGYNLAVWDHIKHWDPEQGNSNYGVAYPMPRTFSLGLELTF